MRAAEWRQEVVEGDVIHEVLELRRCDTPPRPLGEE